MFHKICFKIVTTRFANHGNDNNRNTHSRYTLQKTHENDAFTCPFCSNYKSFNLQIESKVLLSLSTLPAQINNIYINDSRLLVLSSLVRLSAMLPTRSVKLFKTTRRTLRRLKMPFAVSKLIRISSFLIQLVHESLQFVKLFSWDIKKGRAIFPPTFAHKKKPHICLGNLQN